jgi:hypothetical protein
LLALFSLAATAVSADAGREVPVLCLAARDARAQGSRHRRGALARYREAGFALSFSYYEEASPETLRRFPVSSACSPVASGHVGLRRPIRRRGRA